MSWYPGQKSLGPRIFGFWVGYPSHRWFCLICHSLTVICILQDVPRDVLRECEKLSDLLNNRIRQWEEIWTKHHQHLEQYSGTAKIERDLREVFFDALIVCSFYYLFVYANLKIRKISEQTSCPCHRGVTLWVGDNNIYPSTSTVLLFLI